MPSLILGRENLNSAKQMTMAAVYAMKRKRFYRLVMKYLTNINRLQRLKTIFIAGYGLTI
jgi:hypothetical protein